MAKQSGLGDRLFVAGHNLSGDIGSLSRIGGGPAPIEVTGIDKSAFERIGGLRDGAIAYNAFFNPAEGETHEYLSTLPTTDQVLMYCRGLGVGNAAAAMVAKQINYDGTRADDGAFTFAVEAQANGFGLEWGVQITDGIRTDTTDTNGASLDDTNATTFGLQAYLQVLSVTGGNLTVKLQDSPDNGAWTDLTGGGFAAVTGAAAERVALGGAVARYLRVVTSGTFTEAQFVVVVARNLVAVSF